MAEDAQEALAKLLKSLKQMGANKLAEDIKIVIARGTTSEIEPRGGAKELTQSPLQADEAYRIAVEMLIASMEPALIQMNLQHELSQNEDQSIDIEWRQDFVEKSPIETEELASDSLPKVGQGELNEFEKVLKGLISLLQEK